MKRWPLIGAGAALLALAYPPFHLLLPSFLCLVPAILLLDESGAHERPVRRAFANGYWFGVASHAAVLYWMVVALWHFTPLSALGFLATVAILSLWMGGVFAATAWIRRRTRIPLLLVLPVCWTAAEWAIGHQGDIRFPWLGLGTSLTGYPQMVQIADVIGARGVTLLLVMANVALLEGWRRRHTLAGASYLLAVSVGVLAATVYGGWRMRTLPVRSVGRIAVTQPNIGFQEKWDIARQDAIFDSVIGISAEAIGAGGVDMVIWPEATVPGILAHRPSWERAIGEHARAAGVPLVVGGLDYERTGPDEQDYEYWNAAFVFDPDGTRRATPYRKRYLVPITERVPFVNPRWFDLEFFGAFSVGTSAPVFPSPVGAFGILICYESLFPALAADYRRRGADILLNITNDAWFGNTSAPPGHLAHLVMRAIETRAGIARAANSGISGFVDPFGRVSGRTTLDTRTSVSSVVFTTDVIPLAVRWGDWVGILSVIAVGVLLGLAAWRRP